MTGNSPTLTATPADALVDRPLQITVTGLRPGERATITAEFSDLETWWRSEATFEADDDGVVDLTERAPVEGDYDGVRPMGLVQLATEATDQTTDMDAENHGDGTDHTDSDPADSYRFHLTATVDGDRVATTAVTRRVCAPDVERVELDPERDRLVGQLFVPAGDGPHPGVVALHGSGGEPEVRFAKVLASHGVATVALRYVGDPEPIPDRLAEVPVSYVGRIIDWLRHREDVSDADVGVLGVSRGTELAFLTAARRDDVGAVVAYAPSAYVWPGEDADDDEWPSPWTVEAEPLHPVPRPDGDEPRPTETERGIRPRPIFETCVERASDAERATAALPVEDVTADVLLVSGADDGVWHADEMAETLAERLRGETSASEVTHVCHENAGHQAAPPYLPTTDRSVASIDDGPDVVHGGTPEGIADVEARAWKTVLGVFAGLGGAGADGFDG